MTVKLGFASKPALKGNYSSELSLIFASHCGGSELLGGEPKPGRSGNRRPASAFAANFHRWPCHA
jgi:hypothetical protein